MSTNSYITFTWVCVSSFVSPIGPAYDLTFCEVRDHSLVVEWQKPVYAGSGPITGYHVEYAKKGTSDWITANKTAVSHRFLKVRASLIWFTALKVDLFEGYHDCLSVN